MSSASVHLFIRTDCSSTIGIGHFTRCLALAQAWNAQGGRVTFISRCESEALRACLHQDQIEFIPVQDSHPHDSDLELTLHSLNEFRDQNPECLMWTVLDGYHFDTAYQHRIRHDGFRLLLIDDMNHLSYYDTDVLLNQNMHAPALTYHCSADTTLLLGLDYVLLRPEFSAFCRVLRDQPPIARRVLITLGGADSDNLTTLVVQALNQVEIAELEAAIVLGPTNPHGATVRRNLERSHFAWHLYQAPDNMADLMAWADVAVSAGGSTCWEMSLLGLPFMTLILAENQRSVAEGLAQVGASINLGWHGSVTAEHIASMLSDLMSNAAARTEMSQRAQSLIDGQGCSRILKRLSREKLHLRRANIEDCELLWKWANAPDVRAVSFSSAFIPWESHVHWFNSKVNCSDCVFYIAMIEDGAPVGQVRYDISRNEAVVSVCIDNGFRGRGYGPILLALASKKLLGESNVRLVHAYVKENNPASIRAFLKAGFEQVEVTQVKDQPAVHLRFERCTNW